MANTDELVLSRGSDPYHQPRWKVVQAEWFREVFESWIRPYMNRTGERAVHLRGIHYKIYDKGLSYTVTKGKKVIDREYVNDSISWKYLETASKYARQQGLVDPHEILDNFTPSEHNVSRRDEEYELLVDKTDGEMALPEVQLTPLKLELPEPIVYHTGYTDAMQPYYLEIWCEKSTVEQTLLRICGRYNATLVISKGYNTIQNIVAFVDRVQEYDVDKPVLVYYISDFDPAGDNMPFQVARHTEFWLDWYDVENVVKVQPIILTKQQVEDHSLPPKPLKRTIRSGEHKGEVENTALQANWNERHGGGVELDAFEGKEPDEFVDEIKRALSPFFDMRLDKKYADYYSETEDWADTSYADNIAPKYEDRIDALRAAVNDVVATYADEIADLQGRINASLEPHVAEFESIKEEHAVDIDALIEQIQEAVALPEPEIDDDDIDWLYNSDRGEYEQLRIFLSRRSEMRE